jgi:hypothetical protein
MEWSTCEFRRLAAGTLLLGGFVASSLCLGELNDRLAPAFDHPAIRYTSLLSNDPVGLLNAKLKAGSAHLNFDGPQGYLRSILEELKVPVESQVAVFSKSSRQADRISPQNPRTIFFNDSVAVAWMYGGFIELASHDPRQGAIFYTLAQEQTAKPTFQRHDDCVRCHVSDASLGVPGMMVRSMFTAPDGRPRLTMGGFLIDHRSPIEDRWGGYYVTGATAAVRHLGNAMATDEAHPLSMVTPKTLQVGSLETRFDTGHYLSPYSDVGALMVFDHQMYMTNLISRVGWEARAAAYDAAHGERVDTVLVLRESAQEFVDYLLFLDEAPLPKPIQSAAMLRASAFAKTFTGQGPFDRKGRSLRDLDLQSRVLRYPCSYMIYSAAFDALPDAAKAAIYERLWRVLSGNAPGDKYQRLSRADREAVIEILKDTKPDLPAYFHPIH